MTTESQQNLAKAFKEYKWYNSHSLPNEVQIGICRLEIPTDLQISSNNIPADISISAQIISNGIVQHEASLSTHFAMVDDLRNSLVWDYVVSFPLKLKDLTSNSIITFTAKAPDNRVIGGTTMHFFDSNGSLKKGKQKLIFYFGCEADPNTIQQFNKTPGDLYDNYANWDYAFQMEKYMETFKPILLATSDSATGPRSTSIEWLDRQTLSQVQSTLSTALARNNKVNFSSLDNHGLSSSHGQSYEELDLHSFCCLVVEMPQYPFPILYEERAYSNAMNLHQPPTNIESIAQGIYLDYDESKPLEFAIGSDRPFNVNSLIVISDWDVDMDNLSEDMHRRMNHSALRGNFDVHIKPNLQEKEKIDMILQAPANHSMTYEEMDQLYRFRYSLTDNKKALTKFLMAIDWTSESEIAELPLLLSKWKEKGPIDVADALKLLGREKCYQHPPVREYAVEVLQTASDEDLLKYLLQLVQALRYEPMYTTRGIQSSTQPDQQSTIQSRTVSPLAKFLISRGCRSTVVANYLYWYLKVETEDEVSGAMFLEVFETFMLELSTSGDAGKRAAKQLEAQDDYIAKVCQCQRDARDLGRRKNEKEIALRKLLAERELQAIPTKGVKSVPLPLVPEKQISGLNPNTAAMFASAVYPCVIEFYIDDIAKADIVKAEATSVPTTMSPSSSVSAAIVTPLSSKPLTHKIMFKSGDDLRQDQLIMQMISLMDALLKRVNLDLRLLTYGILAVSHNDGIMEFVSNSMPISAILKNHSTLANYLRIHNPDDSGPYGISSMAIDTFVRSCAGYAVITYILGIGDRHLDNLMMTKSGQFFHIDFGFIFGQDPKPLPPPFRLTRSMVDCMGGEDSEHYSKFKSFCFQAYNWLRKSANLILNLLSLMGDAGINDISKRSELSKVLAKVEERFRLDLTDEEAEHYFLSLINESLNSIAPKVMEIAHKIAVSMR